MSLNKRVSNLRTLMAKRRLDALLVSSVSNIAYLTNFSHFSKDEREAFLFITKDTQYILTDGRYYGAVKNKVKDFKLIEISPASPLEKSLKLLAKKNKVKKVGIEHYNITLAEHKKLSSCFSDLKHFSIDNLRTIKDANEISQIEKACALSDKTFEHVLTRINENITEKQLAFEIEFFIKKHGADISFPPIVAFGKNSAFPHHKTSYMRLDRHSGKPVNRRAHPESLARGDSGQARMTDGQFVLLDFGVKLNNYCSDMTRTVFFGKATPEQKRIYQIVLEAQKLAIEFLSSTFHSLPSHEKQIKASQVDKIAREYILKKGLPTIPHSLGHGIGLEVHESPHLSPKSKDILKPNMVFTIEPGVYVPGFGGVRIEDVVLLEKSGPRFLTQSPRNLLTIS